MSAFVIFHSTVKDPAKFQAYAQAVPSTLTPFSGEVALRGKVAGVLAGEHGHQTVGVLKFPDQTTAKDWYDSDAYQSLIPNRDEAADMVVVSYDGPKT